LDPDQLALGLEDIETDIGEAEVKKPSPKLAPDDKPRRKMLPDHLPRHDVVLDDVAHDDGQDCCCPTCKGALHSIGESVSEMLDYVPAELRVIRIRRPKYTCRTCGTVVQSEAQDRVIAGGLATPALLAQVIVAKYCDHTPLYRQSQIFARHGIELARSTLADWVGGACWWLKALHQKLSEAVFASSYLFADDTPVPVLDPGRGRTKTGRFWVYARDERPWGGQAPPAVVYHFAPDRKAERPLAHLKDFKGVVHVDGYAGFEQLTTKGAITLAACWAQVL
jgi:transposase